MKLKCRARAINWSRFRVIWGLLRDGAQHQISNGRHEYTMSSWMPTAMQLFCINYVSSILRMSAGRDSSDIGSIMFTTLHLGIINYVRLTENTKISTHSAFTTVKIYGQLSKVHCANQNKFLLYSVCFLYFFPDRRQFYWPVKKQTCILLHGQYMHNVGHIFFIFVVPINNFTLAICIVDSLICAEHRQLCRRSIGLYNVKTNCIVMHGLAVGQLNWITCWASCQ